MHVSYTSVPEPVSFSFYPVLTSQFSHTYMYIHDSISLFTYSVLAFLSLYQVPVQYIVPLSLQNSISIDTCISAYCIVYIYRDSICFLSIPMIINFIHISVDSISVPCTCISVTSTCISIPCTCHSVTLYLYVCTLYPIPVSL